MSDPERLLDGDANPFERELLSSLATERPGRKLSRHMRQGLVLSGLLTSAKAGMASWVLVAGVVTVGASVGAVALTRRAPDPVPVSLPKLEAPAVPKAVVPPAPPPIEAVPAPAETSDKPAAPAAPAASSGDLRQEILLLDRARAAVRGGNGREALGLLQAYDRKFPRGEFRQEVTVLRIEALASTGDQRGAATLGKRFLAAHPESPHAERIERLVGAAR